MSATWALSGPLELDEEALRAALGALGIGCVRVASAGELLALTDATCAVVSVDAHEDEAILVTRALRRRADRPCVVLVGRGGLVDGLDEAEEAGADHWFAAATVDDLLAVAGLRAEPETGDEGVWSPASEATPALVPAARSDSPGDVLERARYGTYFEVLGLSQDASVTAIADAVVALRARHLPAEAQSPSDRRARDEMCAAVEAAWTVLGNAGLRRRYRLALAPVRD